MLDDVTNTLTVIQITNGNFFGGFTEECWREYGFSVDDPNAFIFSLIDEDYKPFKPKVAYTHYAVYTGEDCGPSFERKGDSSRDNFIASD